MGSNYREIALLSLTGSANSRVLDSVWILCNLQPREDVERAYCTLAPPCRGLGPGGVKTHWINLYFHKNASFTDYSASDTAKRFFTNSQPGNLHSHTDVLLFQSAERKLDSKHQPYVSATNRLRHSSSL